MELTTAPMAEPNPRLIYTDFLRVAACLAVVVLHLASTVDPAYSEQTHRFAAQQPGGWWLAAIVNAATRWCVPVFVMLSGFFLLAPGREETPGVFYHRRWGRVGWPLVFWFAVYTAWYYGFDHERFTWKDFISRTLVWSPYFHLYFLYLLAGLYLVTPFLRLVLRQISFAWTVRITGLLLALAICNHALLTMRMQAVYTCFSWFVPYLGYYLAGYVLRKCELRPWLYSAAWAGWFGSVLFTAGATYGLSSLMDYSARSTYFISYLSPSVAVMSFSVFILARFHAEAMQRWSAPARRWVAGVSACSFGIYLVHPMWMGLFTRGLGQDWWQDTAHAGTKIFLVAPAIFLLSWGVARLMRRIPLVRAVVGG